MVVNLFFIIVELDRFIYILNTMNVINIIIKIIKLLLRSKIKENFKENQII